MITIKVPIPTKEYSVHIKRGILNEIDNYIDVKREIVIITDDFIPIQYLTTIKRKIHSPLVFKVPMGESSKSLEIVYSIINEMIKLKISKGALIIALGGGVIGDLAGFTASIYMRGIDYIQIPTTLLSQIDSSVGGKVGVNSEAMKNSIGSFYQPKVVLIDPDTLKTLSSRQFNNGVAELIKYGLIASKSLFLELSNNDINININIEEYIAKCIQIKTDLVVIDELDKGIRQILNYGHTIGHALEQYSNYNLLHGEAISLGMVAMSKGYNYHETLKNVLNKYSLPTSYEYNKEEVYNFIGTDKKVNNNNINIILVDTPGNALIKTIEINKIREYL